MKIAVTYENGQVFQHFGHTQYFKIYNVENGAVADSRVVEAVGSGHGALAGMLSRLGVDAVVCGGIGGGAQAALAEAGIKLCGGVIGGADEAVNALISGSLNFSSAANCGHHHHGEGHDCGHGCGGNGHGCPGHGA